jgi:predicted signal transduction protein with EAL and GGDEF domain
LVARLGGDEFVIMLQGIKHDHDPARVAAKITDLMLQPFVLGPREYRVTTCIGIAVYPADGLDTETLMRNADTAMYHAKHAGPNRFSHFSKSLNETATKRLDIENGLQEAVANNSLEIHFQPQIDTVLGVPTGAEALLRWRDPERGMVPPSEFIPYAEESGLMTLIGDWVLRAACEQAAQWSQPHGHKLRVGINISTKQLCDDGFPEAVMRIVRETGLDPEQLELEITEHSVLQEVGATLCAVKSLRARGVRIVIDDFGTGYSALSALRSLPIDGIKIDRCFVSDIVTNPADATITRGLIGIASGLGLNVTAEGIENREQLTMLHEFGVQHMQGYLFAKPMVAEEFAEKMMRGGDEWLRTIIEP